MNKFLNFINNNNVRRKAIYALIMCVLFISVTIFGAVTYARFYTSYHEALEAQVAKHSFNFRNESLKLNNEAVTLSDKKAKNLEINDIQPEDIIEYEFSFSDKDGSKTNEVLLRVTLNVTVRLETIVVSSSTLNNEESQPASDEVESNAVNPISVSYFAANDNPYTTGDGVKNGGWLRIYRFDGTGDSTQYIPPKSLTAVDYNCENIYVKEENGETKNLLGFYMEPFDGDEKIHRFRIRFQVPK